MRFIGLDLVSLTYCALNDFPYIYIIIFLLNNKPPSLLILDYVPLCPQVLGVLHEKLSADPNEATLGVAFQLLLQTIQSSLCPSYTAVTLLRAMGHINGEVRVPHEHSRLFICTLDQFLVEGTCKALALNQLDNQALF